MNPTNSTNQTTSTQLDHTTFDLRINSIEQKVDAIYKSVEKTRKYFFWTLVITIALVVLPAIGLVFAIPQFINQLQATTSLSGL